MLLNALSKSGQHAELVRVKLQHPASRRRAIPPQHAMMSDYYYGHDGLLMNDAYGVGSYGSHHRPYPIHDPYWYERRPLQPPPLPSMHYPQYYTSPSSFAFDNHHPPLIRYVIRRSSQFTITSQLIWCSMRCLLKLASCVYLLAITSMVPYVHTIVYVCVLYVGMDATTTVMDIKKEWRQCNSALCLRRAGYQLRSSNLHARCQQLHVSIYIYKLFVYWIEFELTFEKFFNSLLVYACVIVMPFAHWIFAKSMTS